MSGGRGRVLALRAVVWIAIGFVILSGCRQIVAPSRVDTAQVAASVQSTLGLTGFPEGQAVDLAVAFARDYLQYGKGQQRERAERLLAYLPGNLEYTDDEARWTWLDAAAPQAISVGPISSSEPVIDGDRATVVVSAEVGNPETVDPAGAMLVRQWVTLAVPVVRGEDGRLAVGGQPGFLPTQVVGASGDPLRVTVDEAATSSLGKELPSMLTAWAASDENGLRRYMPADASAAARAGLGGLVEFVRLESLEVQKVTVATDTRDALATVRWRYGQSELTQQYRLRVKQGADGLWYVEDIAGAGFTAR